MLISFERNDHGSHMHTQAKPATKQTTVIISIKETKDKEKKQKGYLRTRCFKLLSAVNIHRQKCENFSEKDQYISTPGKSCASCEEILRTIARAVMADKEVLYAFINLIQCSLDEKQWAV